MTDVLPGDYVFDITATVGSTVSTVQFTLKLVDPCNQVTLTIPGVQFESISYDLGSAESNQKVDKIDLVSPTESVTCGNVEIDFYLNDGMMTPLDPLIFEIRK